MSEPITEAEILEIVRATLRDAISKALATGYNTPIDKIVTACVERHRAKFDGIINELIVKTLDSFEFREEILRAFKDKVARVLVSKADGAVEKTVNEYRQNPVFRAKLTMAIEKLIADQKGAQA